MQEILIQLSFIQEKHLYDKSLLKIIKVLKPTI